MKKKNVLVICAAAGLCMVFAMLLIGSMGIYAEKTGTKALTPELSDSEGADMLTKVLADSAESGEVITEGPLSTEELQQIWDTMYTKYDSSERGQEYLARQKEEEEFLEEAAQTGEISDYGMTLDSAKLGVSDAGLIILKEINRLFPEESFDPFDIDYIRLDTSIGMNDLAYISWEGILNNKLEISDKNYVSYSFEIDAITGKIIRFNKFRPYWNDKDYSGISWTDEEILARAKELVETYDLVAGEEIDWSNVEIYNSTDEVPSLVEEFKEEPDSSVALSNTVILIKDGKRYFYMGIDFETGDLYTYIWPGTSSV